MDWRDRFRAGSIYAASVARRNPARGVAVTDRDGSEEAYAWDVESGTLRRLTDASTAVLEAVIEPDGESVVYLHDETGSELGHLRRVPFDGGTGVDLTPDLPPYAAESLVATDRLIAAVAAETDRQHLLTILDGVPRLAPQDDLVDTLVAADDGSFVATAEPMEGLTTRTIVRSTADGSEIGRLDLSRPGAAHGRTLAVALHVDGWLRPATWTPGEEPRRIGIDAPGDVVPTDWLPDGSTILLQQLHRGTGGLWLHDVASGSTTQLHRPDGAPLAWGRPFLLGRDAAATLWSSAEMPRSVVRMTRDGSGVLLAAAGATRYPGAAWAEVTFPSSDDSECQGWLLRPAGDGPWPTNLSAHGGPTSVVGPGFSAIGQAWVDHGFAFLTVNYRGSTTFGDAYREALTGRVGEADVADMVAAHRWLLESGTARPDLVILNGWSWGGYLTLQTMATNPGRWAAGIAGAPVADWIVATEDQLAGLDAYDRALFGTTLAEDRESRIRASPRTHVAEFDAPVLITTPREDSRTPIRQIEAFVQDMRAAGKEIRLDVVPGGHAGIGQEHWIAIMESWLAYAGDIVSRSSR